MENTQLYDFELTDEEMEQIEALEKTGNLYAIRPEHVLFGSKHRQQIEALEENEKHDWY